ncbi:putative ATP-grasp superfamily ATP-dependent carboligase [Sphaerotilus hippei]|uniref:Putative ATP-grasp superfamily ATP-dependent carboligase n=1 Tax=Sphaerotilus hippei TaxID=744406 RepID=A0A318GY64_9BURK|nr:ATP-grasp domain-containing protein [Sphaerotilus hippei]PXW91566.1 putative ATP-grasp superfamily ATP-dependent carboligase [Sphaerotilus hippei]
MKSILVCEFVSAGGLVGHAAEAALMPLGRSMRDAMVGDLLALDGAWSVSAATCAGAALAVGHVGRARDCPVPAGQATLDFLATQAPRHDRVWVVAPETGGLLQRCHEVVGAARWIGCGAEALRLASSKTLSLRCLQARGARTALDTAFERVARRWVVKPDDGAGAVDTQVFGDWPQAEAEARQRLQRGATVTLQPWVEGEAMSASLLCAAGSAELLSLNRQQVVIGSDGRVGFDGVRIGQFGPGDARWAPVQQLARQVATALPGLRGFVGIDLVWHETAGPVAIEVNPRVSCAYVGMSRALERSLAAEILALHPEVDHVGA